MDKAKKNLLLMVPMLHQGGFERVCVKTARLMQDFYSVHIVIFSSKDINYDVTGLDVIDIDVPARKGIVNKVLNVFKRVKKVKKLKRDLGCDIAYSFGSSANYVNVLSGGPGKVLTGLRCQTDMENPRQLRLFCRKSDQVLSCSKEIVRQLLADYNYDKSTYIYNPLDIEDIEKHAAEPANDIPFAAERAEGNVKVISCTGRNDYIKGIWHLVKAFYLVQQRHPEVRLAIYGAGDWSGYKEMAEKLGIADKIAFPGVKKNVFPYVAASDIYVCSSNHEGFPNSVLEGMALRKPLVSADCKTGPREILLSDSEYEELIKRKPDGSSTDKVIEGAYGILVPDMSPEVNMDPEVITDEEKVLAGAIIRLLDDEALFKSYSDKAYERALFYTPEKYRDAIHSVLSHYE